ncbi:hypothetical protein NBRC10513v2_004578 [Rhodotorula toruloides]
MTTQHDHSHSNRTAVGGDSAALVHSSDEEQATSSARRDGSRESAPPPRLSLTSLPAEILDEIFSYVHYDSWTEPITKAMINKELFELVRPHYFHTMQVLADEDDRVIVGLLTRPKNSMFVKDLHAQFISTFQHVQCAVLRQTRCLTRLSILFTDNGAECALPLWFFDALRTLRHLAFLKIYQDERDEPVKGFSFERDVPSLRSLETHARGQLSICAPGLSKLMHLKATLFAPAGPAIPWQTLRQLDVHLCRERRTADDPILRDFVSHLKDSCSISPIPLQILELDVNRRKSIDSSALIRIVEVLRAPLLTDLAIVEIESFAALKSCTFDVQLLSVVRLTLKGRCDCTVVDNARGIRALRALLNLCPATQVLRLEGLRFYVDAARTYRAPGELKGEVLRAIEENDLPFAFPAFAALLFALQQTSVLELNIQLYGGGIRWRRTAHNEVFEAEGWTWGWTIRSYVASRSASADSTAPTARSDEDGSTSSARREGSREPTPPPRLSLTSLPTEVLANIYRYVLATSTMGQISTILTCKRLFDVAYSCWLHTVRISGQHGEDKHVGLATYPKSGALVKELDASFLPVFPQLQCAVLRHTPNLTHLTVAFTDHGHYTPLPDSFYTSLKLLRHLTSLKITFDERAESIPNFSFEDDLPSLRELDIWAFGSLSFYGIYLSNIQRLCLPSVFFAGLSVPWPTLLHLEVGRRRSTPGEHSFQDFLTSLESACLTTNVPLRDLRLAFPDLDPHGAYTLLEFAAILNVLDSLPFSALTHLAIHDIESLSVLATWKCWARLYSVLHLTLHGPRTSCLTTDDLRGLQALLAVCPFLTTLRLDRIKIYASEITPWNVTKAILRADRRGALALNFPELATLLFHIQQTSIIEFVIMPHNQRGVRWYRSSGNELFAGEGLTVL